MGLENPSEQANIDINQSISSMFTDIELAEVIYKPSKFWVDLGKVHKQLISDFGYENFKRSVNQKYHQYLVTSYRDPRFLSVLKLFIKNTKNFSNVKHYFKCKWSDFVLYESSGKKLVLKRNEKLYYKLFLYFLYLHARQNDKFELLKEISEPNYGNPITVHIGDALLSQDLCHSILEATEILEISKITRASKVRILEIGAGYGRLAFVLMSHLSNCKYTITDIPPTLAIAQKYLSQCFPNKKVFYYRNFSDYEFIKAEFEEADIRFILPHQATLLPSKSHNIAINISSFDEMRREQTHNWFKIVEDKCSDTFYLKGWIVYQNKKDDIIVPCVDYPFKLEWKILSFCSDEVNPRFFRTAYRLNNEGSK